MMLETAEAKRRGPRVPQEDRVNLAHPAQVRLGNQIRQLRTMQRLSIAEVAKRGGITGTNASKYLYNIESAERHNVAHEKYMAIARGLGIGERDMDCLILEAEIKTALIRYDVDPAKLDAVWSGLRVAMAAQGVVTTDYAQVSHDLLTRLLRENPGQL